jgi:quercetin dioxygenase-like cupin family protein
VIFEPLGFAPSITVSSPSDLVLIRFRLESGAVLPSDPGDPSVALLVVETGEITIEVDGPVTVTRGGAFNTGVATAEAGGVFAVATEAVPAGEAVTLRVGDAAVIPANLSGELRNDGQEAASGLAAIVAPPEAGVEGTPTS